MPRHREPRAPSTSIGPPESPGPKAWGKPPPVARANRQRAPVGTSGNLDDARHRLRLPSCPPHGPTDRPRDLYGSLSARFGITLPRYRSSRPQAKAQRPGVEPGARAPGPVCLRRPVRRTTPAGGREAPASRRQAASGHRDAGLADFVQQRVGRIDGARAEAFEHHDPAAIELDGHVPAVVLDLGDDGAQEIVQIGAVRV